MMSLILVILTALNVNKRMAFLVGLQTMDVVLQLVINAELLRMPFRKKHKCAVIKVWHRLTRRDSVELKLVTLVA
jgi:hypothetical protein